VDLVQNVIKTFKAIFMYLEDRHGLDINNDIYLFCLHFVFLPRINRSLTQWKTSWNHHKIRTEKHQTPVQLYTRGMIESGFRGMEDEIVDPNDYGIDWEGPIPADDNDNTVFVDDPRNILTDQEFNVLRSLIDPLELDYNGYGVNVYLKTTQIVANILNNRNN
jgi:hypothetical protein